MNVDKSQYYHDLLRFRFIRSRGVEWDNGGAENERLWNLLKLQTFWDALQLLSAKIKARRRPAASPECKGSGRSQHVRRCTGTQTRVAEPTEALQNFTAPHRTVYFPWVHMRLIALHVWCMDAPPPRIPSFSFECYQDECVPDVCQLRSLSGNMEGKRGLLSPTTSVCNVHLKQEVKNNKVSSVLGRSWQSVKDGVQWDVVG